VFGIFAGVYYWFPKIVGRLLDDGIGKIHFWLMLIGFNLTFGPMHILGLNGQPRRTYTYGEDLGWEFWNQLATVGAFLIALSVLLFLYNAFRSVRRGEEAGPDPWDARTLEWSTSSPPPAHNFDEVPVVTALDDFWHRKYAEDENGLPVRLDTEPFDPSALPDDGVERHIHLPSPSYHPIIVALGLLTVAYGFIYLPAGFLLVVPGLILMFWGIFGWALEDIDHPMRAAEPLEGEAEVAADIDQGEDDGD
jgi:cytochrome c oxidase subunit 1